MADQSRGDELHALETGTTRADLMRERDRLKRFIKCDPETYRLLALAKDHNDQFMLIFDPQGRPTFLGAVIEVQPVNN